MYLTGLVLCAATAFAQAVPGYLNFATGEQAIASFVQSNPTLAKLETIGTSAGGRKLHVVTIAAPGKIDPAKRPAIFLGANLVGFHNAGTQAAFSFGQKLIAKKDDAEVKKLLETRTFYIAPMLNPDAHDGLFTGPKYRRSLNAGKLDRDRDGLTGEDGPNDLNNDGRITMMRIPDAAGDWIIDPKDARLMRRPDPLKGEKGTHRLMAEGIDDDKDGLYNEDPAGGYRPDKNFAHAWDDTDPEAGPWPSAAPESKAIMDFFLKHRNISIAFVYGPANNLLDAPRGLRPAGGGDIGSTRVEVPRQLAGGLGLDPTKQYTVDEVFEVAKDSPLARQFPGGLTKEALAQFLGGGPATAPDAEDLRFYNAFSEEYKKILDKAGLDSKRNAAQSAGGGLQNWLYYQFSVMAVELDVWGIPKKSAPAARPGAPTAAAPALSLDAIEKMSADEFTALGEEKLGAFLKDIKAPAIVQPAMLIQGVKSGRMTPAAMVAMMKQQGVGGASASAAPAATATGGPRPAGAAPAAGGATMPDEDTIAYVDASAKEGFAAWTAVTLPDGKKAEVGGVDPFLAVTPNEADLRKAADAHADALLLMSSKLAEVALGDVEIKSLGSGIFEVSATAVNNGFLPTATRLQTRTRSFLPARLVLTLPSGATLVQGSNRASSERINGSGGTLKGTWLVNAAPGAKLTISILTQNAGEDRKEVVLQ